MRVLLLVHEACADRGRHVLDLAAGLLAAGDDVHLFHSIGRTAAVFASSVGDLEGVATHTLSMGRTPSPRDLALVTTLRGYLRIHGPFDVVHGHGSKCGALARIVAIGTSASAAYTPHTFATLNPDLRAAYRGGRCLLERMLVGRCDAVFCLSEEERDHAQGAVGIARQRLHLLTPGVHPPLLNSREATRAELGVADDEVCIGFVGLLNRRKSVDALVAAVAKVRAIFREVRLVVVGTGDMEASLRQQAAALGVADRVSFSGGRDGVRMMAGFDIFALSSRYEGFPYVFCDALAAGLPIVTTAVGGADVATNQGECGIVVEQGNPAAFATALLKLCINPSLRARMSRAARARSGEFRFDAMVGTVRRVYSDIRRNR